MNYNNLSLDSAISHEFSKMGMTVKYEGIKKKKKIMSYVAYTFSV